MTKGTWPHAMGRKDARINAQRGHQAMRVRRLAAAETLPDFSSPENAAKTGAKPLNGNGPAVLNRNRENKRGQ